jgi:para-nitrobenzyl esterase
MRTVILLSILACCLFAAQPSNAEETAKLDPVVAIKSGKVRGTQTSAGGAAFKGVPFAQPPTGELRWRESLPVKPWTGIRDANAFSAECVQSGPGGPGSIEDCLYLNVWTPVWPMKTRLPVMFWIHGGGNFAGSTKIPVYDGESLSRHGVVVVSTNYRLGIFGFLALPELSKESPHHVSGNYGILDQILALRWVHENIAKFGGDPANVTIFGESAGSMDVNVLMATPLSKGLFQRAIAESGPVSNVPPLSEGESKGQGFVAKLNITGDSVLRQLRALPSDVLQKAAGSSPPSPGRGLGIVVDGWMLPKPPLSLFASGQERRVALIIGSNSQEMQKPFFTAMSGTVAQGIKDDYGDLADQALALYGLTGSTEPAPDPEFGPVLAQWLTDSHFRCGTVAELVWHTTAGNTGYQFQFSRAMPGKKALGAPHGSELPYVFGTLAIAPPPTSYNAMDQRISEQMQEYWTNFAKTGDPNGPNLPKWPKFDPASRAYLEFTNSGPVAKEGLRRNICDLYMEKLKRQLEH